MKVIYIEIKVIRCKKCKMITFSKNSCKHCGSTDVINGIAEAITKDKFEQMKKAYNIAIPPESSKADLIKKESLINSQEVGIRLIEVTGNKDVFLVKGLDSTSNGIYTDNENSFEYPVILYRYYESYNLSMKRKFKDYEDQKKEVSKELLKTCDKETADLTIKTMEKNYKSAPKEFIIN